jgi:hypothetical protein
MDRIGLTSTAQPRPLLWPLENNAIEEARLLLAAALWTHEPRMQALDDVIEHGTKAALTQMVDRAAAKSLPALDELRSRRDEVRLLDEVRLAGGRPAKPQTQAAAAAASKASSPIWRISRPSAYA